MWMVSREKDREYTRGEDNKCTPRSIVSYSRSRHPKKEQHLRVQVKDGEGERILSEGDV